MNEVCCVVRAMLEESPGDRGAKETPNLAPGDQVREGFEEEKKSNSSARLKGRGLASVYLGQICTLGHSQGKAWLSGCVSRTYLGSVNNSSSRGNPSPYILVSLEVVGFPNPFHQGLNWPLAWETVTRSSC